MYELAISLCFPEPLQQLSLTVDVQAFINTARTIYRKISEGAIDVSNEVRLCSSLCLYFQLLFSLRSPSQLSASHVEPCKLAGLWAGALCLDSG